MLAMLALSAAACGKSRHEPGPVSAVELPCGLEPSACLDAPALEIPGRHPLVSSNISFSANLEPNEYLQTATPDCENQLVFDVGPDELTGLTIMLEVDSVTNRLEGADCSEYDATIHVYGRESDGSFSLVDYRVLGPDENCKVTTLGAGVGDGRLPYHPLPPHIFLTPTRHPLGLRVVAAVLHACTPAPIYLGLAEQFE